MSTYPIPEQVVPGKRLGRHVRHDPRSLRYLVPETETVASVTWTRRVPIFDQGDVGSCTGNAAAGVLGTDPFRATLPADWIDDEAEALLLYSAAETIDGDGPYPPQDNGSSGLSVAQAAKDSGLISGYQHVTSVAAAKTAIVTGPFIVGSNWYDGMDDPAASGLVKATGSIRGGHEYECFAYDAGNDLWWFDNSWGTSFGVDGTFCYTSATFSKLLSEDGDATVFVPNTQPAPVPTPTPTPTPTPVPSGVTVALDPADYVTLATWTLARHAGCNKRAAQAFGRGVKS